MTRKTLNRILCAFAALGLTLPLASQAADAPPPLADMWLVTPKSGQGVEFRKALAEHMAFRSEHGDPRAWSVYTPLLGEELNRYAIRFCCFGWADQDSYESWQSTAKEINEHFQETVMPYTESWAHYFESMDWGNSHWNESANDDKLFAVTEYAIKPGRAMAFDAAREKLSQIALNQGWANDERSWLWASTIGGKLRESVIIPHENYASFDAGEDSFLSFLTRVMGEEEAARLAAEFADATYSSDFQIWEYREELSMNPGD